MLIGADTKPKHAKSRRAWDKMWADTHDGNKPDLRDCVGDLRLSADNMHDLRLLTAMYNNCFGLLESQEKGSIVVLDKDGKEVLRFGYSQPALAGAFVGEADKLRQRAIILCCQPLWYNGMVGWAWHCSCPDNKHGTDQQCSVITNDSLTRAAHNEFCRNYPVGSHNGACPLKEGENAPA